MSKMTMTAIFAAAMALSAPLAQAQTTTTTQVTRTSTVGNSEPDDAGRDPRHQVHGFDGV